MSHRKHIIWGASCQVCACIIGCVFIWSISNNLQYEYLIRKKSLRWNLVGRRPSSAYMKVPGALLQVREWEEDKSNWKESRGRLDDTKVKKALNGLIMQCFRDHSYSVHYTSLYQSLSNILVISFELSSLLWACSVQYCAVKPIRQTLDLSKLAGQKKMVFISIWQPFFCLWLFVLCDWVWRP